MRVSKYVKDYIVKSYETDCHGFLRLLSLMNLLQDVAIEHADSFGLGLENCLEKNLSWVGSNYLLEISRFPKLHEHFKIETWPAEKKLWGAVRDFLVYDESGNVIIKGSSQWVLIDVVRRRPVMLEKYFPDYETLGERVINTDFPKIPALPRETNRCDFMVRFDDIDVNNHVNNAVYPLWASESISHEYRLNHRPCEIELCFKKEALYGETVTVATYHEADESLHSICDKNSGAELAQCRIVWTEA